LGDAFEASGDLKNPKTKEFLTKFAAAFAAWVETHKK
jgi:hypothetical protein